MNAKEKQAFIAFKARMNDIAKKNGDQFNVTMTCDEHGYRIKVIETADRHVFIESVSAQNVEAAIADAMNDLLEALKSWGYKNV